ncbi:hypothetical protein AMTRI_Chr09g15480 [Amborella trichopoda]
MVASFARSLSLPNARSKTTLHARSVSLPCQPHPVTAQLQDHLQKLNTWVKNCSKSVSSLTDGLTSLKGLYDCFDDLLQLPQTQGALSHNIKWANALLEDLLKLLDSHSTFRAALLALNEQQLGVQVALRRRDPSIRAKLGSFLRFRKKMTKEISVFLPVLASIAQSTMPSTPEASSELFAALRDIRTATVTVSGWLFLCLSLRQRPNSISRLVCSRPLEDGIGEVDSTDDVIRDLYRCQKLEEGLVQKALKKLVVLEDCISSLDKGSESVFRGLIQCRVLLLNVLTQ